MFWKSYEFRIINAYIMRKVFSIFVRLFRNKLYVYKSNFLDSMRRCSVEEKFSLFLGCSRIHAILLV
jgi:hypothetical protein